MSGEEKYLNEKAKNKYSKFEVEETSTPTQQPTTDPSKCLDYGYQDFSVIKWQGIYGQNYDFKGNPLGNVITVTNSPNISSKISSSVSTEDIITVNWIQGDHSQLQMFDVGLNPLFGDGGVQVESANTVVTYTAPCNQYTCITTDSRIDDKTCASNIYVYESNKLINKQQVATGIACDSSLSRHQGTSIATGTDNLIYLAFETYNGAWFLEAKAMELGENGQLKPATALITTLISGSQNINSVAITTQEENIPLVSTDTNGHGVYTLQCYSNKTGAKYTKPLSLEMDRNGSNLNTVDAGSLIQLFGAQAEMRYTGTCGDYKICMKKITFDCEIAYAPTPQPTPQPTPDPTPSPTLSPTSTPTASPTGYPTGVPTEKPTSMPSAKPSAVPTDVPTGKPTSTPSSEPSGEPTSMPTASPSGVPSVSPTGIPTMSPTESGIIIYNSDYPGIVSIYNDISSRGYAVWSETRSENYDATVYFYNDSSQQINNYTEFNISTTELKKPSHSAVVDGKYAFAYTKDDNTTRAKLFDIGGNQVGDEIILVKNTVPCNGVSGLGPIYATGFKGGSELVVIGSQLNSNGNCVPFIQGYDFDKQTMLSPEPLIVTDMTSLNYRISSEKDSFSVSFVGNNGTSYQDYVVIYNKDFSIKTPQKSVSYDLVANGYGISSAANDFAYFNVYVNLDIKGNQQCYAIRLIDGEQKGGIAQLTAPNIDNCSPVLHPIGDGILEFALSWVDGNGNINLEPICRTGIGERITFSSALTGQNCVDNAGLNLDLAYLYNGYVKVVFSCNENTCSKTAELKCYFTEKESLYTDPIGESNHYSAIDMFYN